MIAYGLFVEHYQKYEVIWSGEKGRTIFFQNEMPDILTVFLDGSGGIDHVGNDTGAAVNSSNQVSNVVSYP